MDPDVSRRPRISLTMIVRDEQKNLPALPGVGARGLRRDRRRGYRQHRPDQGDRPRVRGEGVRLRLDRRFRRGAERGAGTRHRRLCILARCRRRGRSGRAGEVAGAARRLAGRRPGRPTSCDAPATRAPTAAAARPSSIISGCSRCGPMSAGRIASTSRSCRPCAGPRSPCAGPTWSSGTPGIPTSPCGPASSTATAGSCSEELNDRPDEPFILFNLGAIAIERKDWREALGYLRREPGALGAERLDHAEAVRPDRPGPPDARRPGRRAAGLRRGAGAGPRGRRAVVPQGGRPPPAGRVGRGGSVAGGRSWACAARAVRQRGHGDLRASDPAQPGRPGRRARATARRKRGSGGRCSRNARATARRGRGCNRSRAPRSGRAGDDPAAFRATPRRNAGSSGISRCRGHRRSPALSRNPFRARKRTPDARGTSIKSDSRISKKNRLHLHSCVEVLHCIMEEPRNEDP